MEARPQNHPLFREAPAISDRAKSIKPYDPVSSLDNINRHPEIEHYKLDWNETTIPPSPKVVQTLVEYLNNGNRLNWYPEMFYKKLFVKLAEYVDCRVSQLIVTNGSDDALELICQSYLNPEDNVVSPIPTYNHFLQFAELTGAEVRRVKGENEYNPSLDEVARAVDKNTKIIYLANPNNPTGNLYSPAAVLKLAQDNPQVLIVSDEAYYEFAGVSCAKLVREVDNIVVTRSFSKCFSLAGLRIGYLVAPELVIGNLRRLHNPKSVNMLAQIAAVATLDDLGYYKKYIREVKRSAALFKRFFDGRGIPCRATYANFILVQFENPKEMARKLSKAGIHVRDRSKHLAGVLRFGLGNEDQTIEILSRIEKILDD